MSICSFYLICKSEINVSNNIIQVQNLLIFNNHNKSLLSILLLKAGIAYNTLRVSNLFLRKDILKLIQKNIDLPHHYLFL